MRTRTLIFTLLAILILSSMALAQKVRPAGKAQATKAGPVRVAKQLGLSKDQAQQIRDIVKKYHTNVRDIAKSETAKGEKRGKITDLKNRSADDVMAVLTLEQREKAAKINLKEMLFNRREKAKRGMGVLSAKLNLSDEQKTTIKSIMADTKEKAKTIKNDTSLDRTAKKAALVQLRQETKDKIMAVLSAEQQAKLKDIQNRKSRK